MNRYTPFTALRKPALALCLEYPLLDFGGTEVLVAELVRGLAAAFELTLVSADRTLAGTWPAEFVTHHLPWFPEEEGPHAGRKLAEKLANLRVRLAHFHSGFTYGWSARRLGASPILQVRRQGIRCLNTNHGFFSPWEGYCAFYRPQWMKAALFPAAWLAKLQVLRALECEVAVSKYDARALRRIFWPVAQRFRQVYHAQLHQGQAPGGRPEAEREKVILCVGTIGFRKGQPLLVEAFARVAQEFSGWRLLLVGRVGQEPVWAETQRLMAQHGLGARVERREGLSHAEVTAWMQRAEVFVMPSQFEGLGLSLQEALFHGAACISTHSGGPEDLIEPGRNGLLVPKDDPAALAEALRQVLGDDVLRTRLRQRGPASVQERGMTAEQMVCAYAALYREILGA